MTPLPFIGEPTEQELLIIDAQTRAEEIREVMAETIDERNQQIKALSAAMDCILLGVSFGAALRKE